MRKFLRFSKDELAARAKITPEQYEALLALRASAHEGDFTIGQLSERLQVKHHSAVTLVAKLVERGLVARRAGTTDRRQVFLKLTPQGSTLLAKVAASHREEIRRRSTEMIEALTRLQK
jgi:DNA-binding MarR family transcriptional regulator